MYLIFDLAVAAVLLIFALRGASKGLVLSLCGLLAVVVAFAGASFAARTAAPLVADALEPHFAAAIEEQLSAQIQAGTPVEELPLQDVLTALKEMGFYEELIDGVNQAVEGGMLDAAAGAAAAVAAALAQSAASAIIFLVAFILLLIVWTAISRSLDLVARLPGLHILNQAGGAVIGLLKGCVFVFVAVWLLGYAGHLIPEEAVRQTHLLRFFLTVNPLELLL